MVGLTPYMRCTSCHRIGRLAVLQRRPGCICGQMEFINAYPTILERLLCWLNRR